MDSQTIVSQVNSFLHEATLSLAAWLESILPRVSPSWWEDCVMNSLSYSQREKAKSDHFTKLSDFDLAALLRIANKSWYDMRTIAFLPTEEREVVRDMIGVRNNWAHCSAELPGKDTIIGDLKTTIKLIQQTGGNDTVCNSIDSFIRSIEMPESLPVPHVDTVQEPVSESKDDSQKQDKTEISINSLVYLVGSPETRGIVVSEKNVGDVTKYGVFVNNAVREYYSGQIALVEETAGYHWVDLDTVRSSLVAYQINNPSSQNLYSLNSARIDFVPYQFRPALKMIHADEPRILIADSVGVGKTIEAGLIIKELEARADVERVLVICPRPLVAERKWEQEMKRFDEEFVPVDGPTLRQIISDTDRDGDWPVRFNKIIVPYSILDSRVYSGEDQKRTHSFGLEELDPEPHFDLVIVDEAHHIRNGSMDKEKAFAYKCTKYFCDHADAVVMLTATPLQTSDDDLFTLLNVLRPDVVIDKKTFEMMSRPNVYINRAIHAVRSAEDDWQKVATEELIGVQKTQWGESVIAENPLYEDLLIRLEKENISREDRVTMISDIESLHSFGSMLNRTRRRDIQDFCVRRSHTISTEFTAYQRELHDELLSFEKSALSVLHDSRSVPFMMSTIKRQAASCIFGLAPHIRDIISRRIQQMNDDPDLEFSAFDADEKSSESFSKLAGRVLQLADNLPDEDPKFDALCTLLQKKSLDKNNKIMLFSTFRHTLAYLNRKLQQAGYRVAQVDGSVKDEDRYLLKERFELPRENQDSIDIMLFTEVGSEGLDYQFCDSMINYDLPWNPMRIEQRIGRIDRRGQKSDVVNIYNMITEETVDADIYYRCLMRIGVFESSIGDCEEILGEIASGIESVITDSSLTEHERQKKLEQIADNEVRKIQEMNRLEEEEKELFGFDLTEFTTSQEIRHAENPWLTQKHLQRLIEHYLTDLVGNGTFILGEGPLKTIRLSATARGILRDDLRTLPVSRNALRRSWENYLSGKNPNHPITFDSETAANHRETFFITPMHPLARLAARHFEDRDTVYLKMVYGSSLIKPGQYPFSVYAWKYTGFNPYTKLVTICADQTLANDMPDILETASGIMEKSEDHPDWSVLEAEHVKLWQSARDIHKREVHNTVAFKLESLSNNHRGNVRRLEQQIRDSIDDSIRRMRMSELENVKEKYKIKEERIQETAQKADVYATLLVNGVITIVEE